MQGHGWLTGAAGAGVGSLGGKWQICGLYADNPSLSKSIICNAKTSPSNWLTVHGLFGWSAANLTPPNKLS